MHKPVVLILCTGNSCRSQMAEGFLRKYAGEQFEVHSAGTEPRDHVHPIAVRVMAEVGVDISGQRPKEVSPFLRRGAVHHLLIVCDHADQACPRDWPGALTRTYLPFEDPDRSRGSPEDVLKKFREVRDRIEHTMRSWQPEPRGSVAPSRAREGR